MADVESTGKKPPILKLLLMGGIGLLVLALVGGGGFFGYKKWKAYRAAKAAATAATNPPQPPKEGDEDEEEPEPAAGGEGEASGPAVLIYRNNVNLEGKKNAYLVVELNILFRDPELGKLATSEKPTPENSIIRSILLELLSGKTLEEASDLETRESMRVEIKDKLNEKFAPKPLKPGEKEDKKHKKPKKPIKDVLVVSWAIAQ